MSVYGITDKTRQVRSMNEQIELGASLQRYFDRVMARVNAQREEILVAFLAKYGCEPDDVEQVVEATNDGQRYYIRKRINSPTTKGENRDEN